MARRFETSRVLPRRISLWRGLISIHAYSLQRGRCLHVAATGVLARSMGPPHISTDHYFGTVSQFAFVAGSSSVKYIPITVSQRIIELALVVGPPEAVKVCQIGPMFPPGRLLDMRRPANHQPCRFLSSRSITPYSVCVTRRRAEKSDVAAQALAEPLHLLTPMDLRSQCLTTHHGVVVKLPS